MTSVKIDGKWVKQKRPSMFKNKQFRNKAEVNLTTQERQIGVPFALKAQEFDITGWFDIDQENKEWKLKEEVDANHDLIKDAEGNIIGLNKDAVSYNAYERNDVPQKIGTYTPFAIRWTPEGLLVDETTKSDYEYLDRERSGKEYEYRSPYTTKLREWWTNQKAGLQKLKRHQEWDTYTNRYRYEDRDNDRREKTVYKDYDKQYYESGDPKTEERWNDYTEDYERDYNSGERSEDERIYKSSEKRWDDGNIIREEKDWDDYREGQLRTDDVYEYNEDYYLDSHKKYDEFGRPIYEADWDDYEDWRKEYRDGYEYDRDVELDWEKWWKYTKDPENPNQTLATEKYIDYADTQARFYAIDKTHKEYVKDKEFSKKFKNADSVEEKTKLLEEYGKDITIQVPYTNIKFTGKSLKELEVKYNNYYKNESQSLRNQRYVNMLNSGVSPEELKSVIMQENPEVQYRILSASKEGRKQLLDEGYITAIQNIETGDERKPTENERKTFIETGSFNKPNSFPDVDLGKISDELTKKIAPIVSEVDGYAKRFASTISATPKDNRNIFKKALDWVNDKAENFISRNPNTHSGLIGDRYSNALFKPHKITDKIPLYDYQGKFNVGTGEFKSVSKNEIENFNQALNKYNSGLNMTPQELNVLQKNPVLFQQWADMGVIPLSEEEKQYATVDPTLGRSKWKPEITAGYWKINAQNTDWKSLPRRFGSWVNAKADDLIGQNKYEYGQLIGRKGTDSRLTIPTWIAKEKEIPITTGSMPPLTVKPVEQDFVAQYGSSLKQLGHELKQPETVRNMALYTGGMAGADYVANAVGSPYGVGDVVDPLLSVPDIIKGVARPTPRNLAVASLETVDIAENLIPYSAIHYNVKSAGNVQKTVAVAKPVARGQIDANTFQIIQQSDRGVSTNQRADTDAEFDKHVSHHTDAKPKVVIKYDETIKNKLSPNQQVQNTIVNFGDGTTYVKRTSGVKEETYLFDKNGKGTYTIKKNGKVQIKKQITINKKYMNSEIGKLNLEQYPTTDLSSETIKKGKQGKTTKETADVRNIQSHHISGWLSKNQYVDSPVQQQNRVTKTVEIDPYVKEVYQNTLKQVEQFGAFSYDKELLKREIKDYVINWGKGTKTNIHVPGLESVHGKIEGNIQKHMLEHTPPKKVSTRESSRIHGSVPIKTFKKKTEISLRKPLLTKHELKLQQKQFENIPHIINDGKYNFEKMDDMYGGEYIPSKDIININKNLNKKHTTKTQIHERMHQLIAKNKINDKKVNNYIKKFSKREINNVLQSIPEYYTKTDYFNEEVLVRLIADNPKRVLQKDFKKLTSYPEFRDVKKLLFQNPIQIKRSQKPILGIGNKASFNTHVNPELITQPIIHEGMPTFGENTLLTSINTHSTLTPKNPLQRNIKNDLNKYDTVLDAINDAKSKRDNALKNRQMDAVMHYEAIINNLNNQGSKLNQNIILASKQVVDSKFKLDVSYALDQLYRTKLNPTVTTTTNVDVNVNANANANLNINPYGKNKKKDEGKDLNKKYSKYNLFRLQDPFYRITGKQTYSDLMNKLMKERYGNVYS